MVSSLSRFKNIFGEPDKSGSFDSLTPKNNQNTDGQLVDVSPDFLAVNWHSSGGGQIAIFQTTKYCRVASGFPLIRGHKAAVTDLKFSPFNSSLLCSSSEDGTIKLWQIPEEGLKQDLSTELQVFNEHNKKVSLINFHPTVKEVIASCGSDSDLFVWNITDSSVLFKHRMEDQAYSIEWNSVGSLLGVMNKNKKASIYDVRIPDGPVLLTEGHGSGKVQKFGFADGNFAFSTGFHNNGYREIKLYDVRAFDKPLVSQKIDTMSGMMSHYYDEDLGILYVYGKGEGSVTYMEVKDGTIKTGSSYSSSEQAISLAFFPKRTMDYNTCELARAAKLTKDKCYYLSFKYPRRNEGFSEEFYPECTISEPSMSLDEWKSGENKSLARKKITEIENKFKSEPMIFDKKVEKSNVTSGDNLAAENELLKKEVEELKEKLNSLHRHNDELVARNEDLTREIESIRNTNAN